MVEITWTRVSIRDLKEIYEYIAQDSERYAQITVNKIYQRAKILESNPRIGKIVSELKDDRIREIVSGNYRIIYHIIHDNRIDILRVFHSARLLKKNSNKF